VSDSAADRVPVRSGGDCRSGGDPRNPASSRRVNSPRSCWRLAGGDSASGSRVGSPGGGSPLVSGAGRCVGLGTGRRMMLGSITTSVRPPTSTRCSVSSRRTRTIFRFPSSGTDSITPTRRDALRRSHLNMCFFRHGMSVSDFIYCRTFPMIPQRPINCENVKEMSNPTRDRRAMIAAGMIHVTIGAVRISNRPSTGMKGLVRTSRSADLHHIARSGGSQNSP